VAETRTTSSTGGQKGTKLARHDLIPTGPLNELAEHYGRGARKYANHQWRNGYEWSKSFAAKQRHDLAFWGGHDYDVCENDPDGCSFVDADGEPFEGEVTEHGHTCFNHTGSHHMVASAWHAFCLLEFKDRFPEHDDRYKPEVPDEDDDEPRFPGRVWVGQAKLLPEDGWEEVGYTTDIVDGFGTVLRTDVGTHDYDCALDIDLASLCRPQTIEFEFQGEGALEMIQALHGVFNSKPRFEASAGGMRDLEKPLPKDVEDSIDEGWTLLDLIFGKWFLAAPHALEFKYPSEVHRSIFQDRESEIAGYVGEYRHFLRKHAPGVDSVGGVL
jgi:hypothetical protein